MQAECTTTSTTTLKGRKKSSHNNHRTQKNERIKMANKEAKVHLNSEKKDKALVSRHERPHVM